jgi:D-tyrosyl-tRNA(Tyr) deacylase
MKALIQRVTSSSVEVSGEIVGQISSGILVFLGVEKGDDEAVAQALLDKILVYRIFEDESGKMNLGLKDVEGELLVVSQFTLAANTKKGRRPSFSEAGSPELANSLYEYFIDRAKEAGVFVQSGEFGADMKVSLVNDGPVTFMLEV